MTSQSRAASGESVRPETLQGSEAAFARRGGLALEEELRGRKRRFPLGRKNERDPPFESLGSGVGIGEGEKETADEPLHRKLVGMLRWRSRGSALSFSPKEETSGLGKPVPVYDDQRGLGESSRRRDNAPAKRPTLKDSQTDEENQRGLRMAGRRALRRPGVDKNSLQRDGYRRRESCSTNPIFVRLGKPPRA